MNKTSILVLIPHFNNLNGLHKSLSSISNQEPVDTLIVDDGSGKKQKPDQATLQEKYPNINKIICINNDKNRGIEYVLNDGLKFAQEQNYEYIARLDCGDLCHPERFKLQKEFLDTYPNHYLVGCWVSFVNLDEQEVFQFKPETKTDNIKKKMPIANQFSHPAVMFRTKAIETVGYYPLNRKAAEDYAYFYNFVDYFETANIPKILLDYEINPGGISLQSRKKQIQTRLTIIKEHFKHTPHYYYGYLRNLVIYFLPYKLVESLKRLRK